jgi:pyruvoyl-dependent arginine decarboxylase (PvlArgDC)
LSVSSGIRPGAQTTSGNQSYHATGDAIDLSGPPGGMMATFRFLKKNFGSRLRELIYTPGGAGINDGRPYTYTGATAADHYDHVHVAYTGPFGDGIGDAARAAKKAGFRGNALVNAVAVAGPESRYRDAARLVTSEEDSRGMWQINTYAHPWARGMNLRNTDVAARAAYKVWREAGGFGPWTAFSSGSYRAYLSRARAAVAGLSGGGASGAGGGGGGAAGTPQIRMGKAGLGVAGVPSQGLAPGASAGGFIAGSQGMEVDLAGVAVQKALAEKKDNLSGLIKALVQERAIKRHRLKLVTRTLRKVRMGKKRRARLRLERAELIGEITELTATIKEYKADRKGGATTISAAEQLEAGVGADTGDAGAADVPSATDFLDRASALAALTPGTADDIAAARGAVSHWQRALAKARGTADPRDDTAAAQGLRSALDTLDNLTKATEAANRLAEEDRALRQEQVANQRKIIQLASQQPHAIIRALVAAMDGGIGGPVGLSYQTVGYAGATAQY